MYFLVHTRLLLAFVLVRLQRLNFLVSWYVCVCGDGVVGVVIVFIGQRIHFIIWYDWAPINESLFLHNIAHYFIEY